MIEVFGVILACLLIAPFVIGIIAVLIFGTVGATAVLASIGMALHRLFRF
jgi:hypothetical protein